MRLKYHGPVIIAGTLLLASALGPAAPEEGPDHPSPRQLRERNTALAREQLALVKQAESDLETLYKAGQLNLYDPRITVWGRRKVEATRALGVKKEEMIAVLEEYVARMKTYEDAVTKAREGNQLSRLDVQDVHYKRLEAEMWLNDERAR